MRTQGRGNLWGVGGKLIVKSPFHYVDELHQSILFLLSRVKPCFHNTPGNNQRVTSGNGEAISDRESEFVRGCPFILRNLSEGRDHLLSVTSTPVSRMTDPGDASGLKWVNTGRASRGLTMPRAHDGVEHSLTLAFVHGLGMNTPAIFIPQNTRLIVATGTLHAATYLG